IARRSGCEHSRRHGVMSSRIDRIETRLDRIERRLDLTPAPSAKRAPRRGAGRDSGAGGGSIFRSHSTRTPWRATPPRPHPPTHQRPNPPAQHHPPPDPPPPNEILNIGAAPSKAHTGSAAPFSQRRDVGSVLWGACKQRGRAGAPFGKEGLPKPGQPPPPP